MSQGIAENLEALEKTTVLAVDDEPYNLEILGELLEDEGYQVVLAENGAQALKQLSTNPERFNTVLLDRMMPDMDGLDVLLMMKKHPLLRYIPVIIQTAKATISDIQEGLDCGVIYFLTKPFTQKHLSHVVSTSVNHYQLHQALRDAGIRLAIGSNEQKRFEFSTLLEARRLSILLASLCPDPHRALPGLYELLVNAVEHGNLDIGYRKKSVLLQTEDWLKEVEIRLRLPVYAKRKATVSIERNEAQILFTIEDEGQGFDAQRFFRLDPERAINTHGRGIAIASTNSFDTLEYLPPNNKLIATVKLDADR